MELPGGPKGATTGVELLVARATDRPTTAAASSAATSQAIAAFLRTWASLPGGPGGPAHDGWGEPAGVQLPQPGHGAAGGPPPGGKPYPGVPAVPAPPGGCTGGEVTGACSRGQGGSVGLEELACSATFASCGGSSPPSSAVPRGCSPRSGTASFCRRSRRAASENRKNSLLLH